METKEITWTPKRISELRKRLNMSQVDFADHLGYSRQASVSDIERGVEKPSESVCRVLDFLAMHVDEFYHFRQAFDSRIVYVDGKKQQECFLVTLRSATLKQAKDAFYSGKLIAVAEKNGNPRPYTWYQLGASDRITWDAHNDAYFIEVEGSTRQYAVGAQGLDLYKQQGFIVPRPRRAAI